MLKLRRKNAGLLSVGKSSKLMMTLMKTTKSISRSPKRNGRKALSIKSMIREISSVGMSLAKKLRSLPSLE